jgi:hypothetical protein
MTRYDGVMASWVLDRSIGVLIEQYLSVRPQIKRSEVGTIADDNHSSASKHSPEDTSDSQDRNDPDNQVDAADFPHDPARGSDMAVFTEELRVSKDKRLWLVIFNGRQFSSYARDGYAPFTWRPYSGSNKHTKHAHVEVNDYHNDVTTPWKVDMSLSAQDRSEVIKGTLTPDNVLHFRLRSIQDSEDPVVREKYPDWADDSDAPGLKQVYELVLALADAVDLLTEKVNNLSIPAPAPVDPESLKAVLMDPEVVALLD